MANQTRVRGAAGTKKIFFLMRSGWEEFFFANLASQAGICDVSIYAKYDGQIHLTIYSKAHGTYKVKGEKTKYS